MFLVSGHTVSFLVITSFIITLVSTLSNLTLRAVNFSYAKREKLLRATVRSFELTAVQRHGRITFNFELVKLV